MPVAQIREKHDGALAGQMGVRVWLRLLSCTTVIEKRLRRRFVSQFDTTLPRFDVMATLERYPEGVTMGELSRALLVSNGNVTALVKQLESDGHVSSCPAPDDRRSLIVALTDQGRRNFSDLAAAHRKWIQGMFAEVSDEDQIELYRLLAKLKHSIGAEE